MKYVHQKMNKKKFTRKIFTARLFFKDFGFLLSQFIQISAISKNKEISKAFFEKIMTIVSAVNGCVYCQWFHAKKAVSSGISTEEVKKMLNLQFQTEALNFELPALLYAQHFAETNRQPDDEMLKKLTDFYGQKTANHIQLIIRMIFFGNLYGNTFDAFLSRFKGQKAENSNIIFEFFFFIFNIPFMLPLMPFVKKYRK